MTLYEYMNLNKITIPEMSRILNTSYENVKTWRYKNSTPRDNQIREKLKELGVEYEVPVKAIYAFYKGETYLCEGTIEECAEFLKISIRTAKFYTTPSAHKRDKGNKVVGFRVDEGDDDDDY